MTENTERELGSETATCPNCGAPLAMTENADGSSSPVNCERCYPAAPTEQASARPVPRETGSPAPAVATGPFGAQPSDQGTSFPATPAGPIETAGDQP